MAISDALNLKTIRSEALQATLNALTAGVYLVDRHGRIIYMNRAAEHQVETGNALRVEHDRLAPLDRSARIAIGNAIAEAIADEAERSASGISLALPAGEGAGLIATVLPLGRGERRNVCGAFAAMAAIFMQDPVIVPPFPGGAFAKLHGLTGSELRVLLAMAPGLGVKEAAEVLGISEATARTHLQHIFAKTGTSKQTELMHLFMSSARQSTRRKVRAGGALLNHDRGSASASFTSACRAAAEMGLTKIRCDGSVQDGNCPEISLETFSKVVEAVYDCALDPNRWHDTVRMIADLLASQRCTLGVHDYANGCNDLMFQVGWDDEHYWRLHEEKYSRHESVFCAPANVAHGGCGNPHHARR